MLDATIRTVLEHWVVLHSLLIHFPSSALSRCHCESVLLFEYLTLTYLWIYWIGISKLGRILRRIEYNVFCVQKYSLR